MSMNEPLFLRLMKPWKRAMDESFFSTYLVITLIILLILGIGMPYFFEYIQNREGMRINDNVLALLPSEDVSHFIFPVIYISIVVAIVHLLFHPQILLKTLQAYAVLSLLRVGTIYFLNLEPPIGIVELKDPFISYFFYNDQVVDKDLFFSGHTATMVLLMLAVRNIYFKGVLLLGTISIAILLLIQHVHYTVDVLAAPIFALISYRIVQKLL